MTGLLGEEAIDNWGWRIPFLLGSLIAICGFLIRRASPREDYVPSETAEPWYKEPMLRVLTTHGRQMVQAIGIAAFFAGGFYLIFIYLTTYLSQVVGYTETEAFDINTITMIIYTGLSSRWRGCLAIDSDSGGCF